MHGSLKITRRRGGQVLSFVTGLIASVGASANPQGAQVVSGSAVFANPTPQTLEITNSPAAVLNWQSFDIGKGEITRFIQQNAASTVLNRVTTGNSSEILGSLVSNGQVFLINPAGILIGRDGSVDTAGVVLSTLQITNEDFLAGRFRFEGDSASGTITNHGYIKTAPGGEVVLIAPRIENVPQAGNSKSGLIESPNGDLVLAAGTAITIASLDDPDITFEVRAPDNEVVNIGRLLARGGTASILAGTIRHSGEIDANTVSRDAEGRISLKASNRISLAEGSSVHASGSDGEKGGTISIDARNDDGDAHIDALGSVRADGERGGKVVVRADHLLVDGMLSARGNEAGGTVSIKSTDAFIATANANLRTSSSDGRGGRIHVDGGESTFTSGTMNASGERGGNVTVLGDEVTLAAANIRADGEQGGGRVRVGGGFRGGEDLRGAAKVEINDTSVISANARVKGEGGDVVVWADGTTQFAGTINARGGAQSGDGGRVEVSGRAGLGFSGEVDVTARNGDIGSLLLDPKNIRFSSDELPAAPIRLLDPHPGADNFFGESVDYFDASGNRLSFFNRASATTMVVYDMLDDFGGADAGAVYVYRLSDGALLSNLHGSSGQAGGDRVGNDGLDSFVLNGQSLLRSSEWGGGAGALTVFDPVRGTSGVVDASNSLVGAAPGDNIGDSSIQFLGGNSAAVLSPNFNSGAGAITIVTPGTLRGTVSSANSLVGANGGDQLGSSLSNLGGGHWAARSSNGGLGSITILHAGTRTTGVVGAGNSLVGSVSGDAIGDGGLVQIGNSNFYRTTSTQWNGGVGAVTWIDRTSTPTGEIDASNSLLGSLVGDLGNGGAQFENLGGGNLLLFSENGGAGAVTFISPTAMPIGLVSSSNSLVGTLATDGVGQNVNGGSRNYDFFGGKIAIYSPNWNNGAGAVTFGDITNGLTADVVSSANSLVGASSGDFVGDSHIRNFGGNNFGLLVSNNGGAGAITPIDSRAPLTGTVGSLNSLVGSDPSDDIGNGGIQVLTGSTVFISSLNWTAPGAIANAGAVTLFNADTGTFNGTATPMAGLITQGNSLVGTEANDSVGIGGVRFAYFSATEAVFVVQSESWANTPTAPAAGALTFFRAGDALSGQISSSNSLIGTGANDAVGAGNTFAGSIFENGLGSSDSGVYQLNSGPHSGPLGNALVYIPTFGNGAGAIVHIDGSLAPPTGAISSSNALIGGSAGDDIGSNGIFDYGNGHYFVLSPKWDNFSSNDAGAITIAGAASGVTGLISSANSLVGDQVDDRVGSRTPDRLDSGTLLFRSPNWHADTGAVTFVNTFSGSLLGDTDFAATLDSTNSLTGINAGDDVGANGSLREVSFGNYVLLSSSVSEFNGPINVGAVTFFSDTTGIAGLINSSNSLVGTHAGDQVGSGGLVNLFSGNVLIESPLWNGNAGALTFLDVGTGHFGGSNAGVLNGALGQTNSLVGRSANDSVGSEDIQLAFANGNGYYMVFSPQVDNTNTNAVDAGAVTFGNDVQGVRGFADDNTVSFVGTAANDAIGVNANTDSTDNGNVFLINPQWNGDTGAVTFIDLVNGTGLAGDVDASTSVVGSFAGDRVGIDGVQMLNNHVVAIRSPDWSNGGTTPAAGAITWASELTGGSGLVSSSNSLLGSNAGDLVGDRFISFVSGTSNLYVVRTDDFDGGKSALTFIDTTGSLPTDFIGNSNSLVGSTDGDDLGGSGIFTVGAGANRRVVVLSPDWDNGSEVDAGAITTFLPNAPKTGPVDNTNSLVGTHASDEIGNGSFTSLSNGNQLLRHSNWFTDRGAITFWNMSVDLIGDVGPGNSLVGANSGDFVGSTTPQEISGSNHYMVRTTSFNSNAGALTFGRITTGVSGVMGPANSLVGANADDFVGSGINANNFSATGSALMRSTHGGRGAVTFINPNNPPRGVVSAQNSLVGSTDGDGLNQSIRDITGTIRVVLTPNWDNGAAVDAGAFTMVDMTTGRFAGTNVPFAGRISDLNSLVGSHTADRVGSSSRFNSIGTYVVGGELLGAVFSSFWNENRGAITWFTPGEALVGEISPSNSLVGSFANDRVGGGTSSQIDFFNTQSSPPSPAPAFAAVFSPNWNSNRGAITWFKPGERPVGRVTAKNSFVGAFPDDFVGDDLDESFSNGMFPLPTGNFVLLTPSYNSDGGAVTFLNLARPLPLGEINGGNSFVGAPGSRIGSRDIVSLGQDRVLIFSPNATVEGNLNAGRIDLLDGSKTQAVDTIGFGSNPDEELTVSIPAVVNFLNSGGTLTLQASNDIFIPEGLSIVAKGGSLTLEAGRSIDVKGNIFTTGFLKLFANSKGGDLTQRDAGEGFVSILADTKPSSVIANILEVDSQNLVVQGGNAKGAYALLYGIESAKIFAHGSGLVSLKAGTGEDVPPAPSFELLASLLPGQVADGNPITIDAPIALLLAGKSLDVAASEFVELFGGGSAGAFAAIASFGELKVDAPDIKMEVGSVTNTDAVFLGMGGAADITFTTCTGCGDLLGDPLLDSGSQTGTFLAGLFVEPTINAVLANILSSEPDGAEPATDEEDEEEKKESSLECH